MKMTTIERRALDEAQDVGAVLAAVAAMRSTRGGALPEANSYDEALRMLREFSPPQEAPR